MLSETICPDTIGKPRHAGKKLITLSIFLFSMLFSYSITAQHMKALMGTHQVNYPKKIMKPTGNPLPAGTYTIGTAGNFPTIDSAFNKLGIDGISGPVTLELIDTLYNAPKTETGFLLNGPIPGAGQENRVTIKPATNINSTIQGSGYSVLYFSNTSYLTLDGMALDGSALTIRAFHGGTYIYNTAVKFVNNSNRNIVQNITAISEDKQLGNGIAFIIDDPKSLSAPDSNLIQNNFVKKAGIGIYISGHMFNVGPVKKAVGNIIRGNFIGSETDKLITLGIIIENSKNTIIENNTVWNITYNSNDILGAAIGINSYIGTESIIRNNIVHSILDSCSEGGVAGIGLSGNTNELGSNNSVYNNMIYDIHCLSKQATSGIDGLYMSYQNNPKVYFNSVYLNGKGSSPSGSAALSIYNNCSNVAAKNNILINTRDESPYFAASIYNYTTSNLTSDNNDLYCEPNQYNSPVKIGNAYYSLPDWQAKGKDLHSISEMPNFTAPDLHIDQNIPNYIESAGTQIAGISEDFDGDIRNTALPDIGADEFNGIIKPQPALAITPTLINFGNLKTGEFSDTISVVVKNLSSEVVTVDSITKSSTEFNLFDLPSLPFLMAANDSILLKVFFHPLEYGTFRDIITVFTSDTIKPNVSIFLKGDVLLLGAKFQEFYDQVNSASTIAQKNSIINNFLYLHPRLPFIEDTIAHFIYKGAANSITVPGDANEWDITASPMTNIESTNLWFCSEVFERDARLEYQFVINDTGWILDPRNRRNFQNGPNLNSELAMPEYVYAPEIKYYSGISHGTLFDTTIFSNVLGNTYYITEYIPPMYDPAGIDSFEVALFHDGGGWIDFANTKNALDYLIHHNRIRPLVAVFVNSVNRDQEYIGNRQDQFAEFIANVIMPYIDSKYRTKKRPESRATLGISNGGNIALWILHKHSKTFGSAASFSGNILNTTSSAFENELMVGSKLYIDAGTYEPYILNLARNLRQIMQSKSYNYQYNEWHEGHGWGNWGAHLDIALEFFFPGTALDVEEEKPLPLSLQLMQNYPNPFNPTTNIQYAVSSRQFVTLKIYNVLGKEIVTLINEEKPAGNYEITWNAKNLASGVYFYKIQAGSFNQVRKMLLIK